MRRQPERRNAMTFRSAALIHKRRQQPRRRIIPGVALAAATIMAAVLFLATAGAARADSPIEPPPESAGCDGLMPITLTPSTQGAVRAESVASSADCSVRLELSTMPAADTVQRSEAQPCAVTATPHGSTGRRVSVSSTGNCDGIEIQWSIVPAMDAQRANAVSTGPTAQSRASTSAATTAYSLLVGEDAIGIDMIKNWSEATWRHTDREVLSWQHRTASWGTPHEFYIFDPLSRRFIFLRFDGWTVTSEIAQVHVHSAADVEAINFVNFHVDIPVLPDSRAFTSSSIHMEPNGSFHCDYSLRWQMNYAFTMESECDTR